MRARLAALALALALATLLAAPAAAAELPPVVDTRAEYPKFDPAYRARLAPLRRRGDALADAVHAEEAAGRPARCAAQVLTELRWRTNNTADYGAIAADADRLEALLKSPDRAPDHQDPADGAWGRCYRTWTFKLDASYDALSELGDGAPAVAPRFLDRVNDPERLEAYLTGLLVSEIARDGVNRRRELNQSLSDLMRLILREKPAGYAWHPGLKARLLALIHGRLRDPATGFWGPVHRIEGRDVRVPDLSITFHVAKYLDGAVSDWPRLLDTLLAMRDRPYPQGWRQRDGYLVHDIYDVVTLFRLGFPHANEAQQAAIRAEVGRLLAWALAHTVAADGTVRLDENDDSVETAYYFAVGFLDEVGYLDPRKRFWTERDLSEGAALAAALRARIEAALASGASGEGGVYYRNALARLDGLVR
jgi:hypothetical protein